jgi:hypothetical protein
MSYLTIVQRAAALLSLPQPASVVASTDPNVIQLGALANEVGEELSRDHNWQALTQQYLFTTSGTEEQPDAVPDDLDRFLANTFFNRTTIREMDLITPQQWQAIKTLPALGTPFIMFRERDGVFLTTPTPPAGQQIAYEYVSANWALSPSNTPQPLFVADADTTYLEERLIRLGTVWRFKQTKGLDYGEDLKTYEIERQKAMGKDGANTALNMGGSLNWGFGANIQTGNFPG